MHHKSTPVRAKETNDFLGIWNIFSCPPIHMSVKFQELLSRIERYKFPSQRQMSMHIFLVLVLPKKL